MNNISVVLITKNATRHLKACLESLKAFDEVVIYDNGSEDNTIEIAQSFANVSVHTGPFLGFGKSKKHAANLATNSWIFSLDADEIMSEALVEELLSMPLDINTLYEVRRDNYYHGKLITCCGWYGEYIARLYHKEQTNFSDAMVHETVEIKNLTLKKLQNPIKHYSFDSVGDFLNKIQSYSEIYAKDMQGKKDASLFKAVSRGAFAFFKSYILRRGFLAGFEGFVICYFHALGTTIKYLKLHEKNRPT